MLPRYWVIKHHIDLGISHLVLEYSIFKGSPQSKNGQKDCLGPKVILQLWKCHILTFFRAHKFKGGKIDKRINHLVGPYVLFSYPEKLGGYRKKTRRRQILKMNFGSIYAKTCAAGPLVTRFCSNLHHFFSFFMQFPNMPKTQKQALKTFWVVPPP